MWRSNAVNWLSPNEPLTETPVVEHLGRFPRTRGAITHVSVRFQTWPLWSGRMKEWKDRPLCVRCLGSGFAVQAARHFRVQSSPTLCLPRPLCQSHKSLRFGTLAPNRGCDRLSCKFEGLDATLERFCPARISAPRLGCHPESNSLACNNSSCEPTSPPRFSTEVPCDGPSG